MGPPAVLEGLRLALVLSRRRAAGSVLKERTLFGLHAASSRTRVVQTTTHSAAEPLKLRRQKTGGRRQRWGALAILQVDAAETHPTGFPKEPGNLQRGLLW